MAHIIENGKVAEWFKNKHRDDSRSAREIIDDELESGERELFGNKCDYCGRTWADGNDDHVNVCYEGEGCNA